MLENQEVLSVPDTPENRQLWLCDFRSAELRDTLRLSDHPKPANGYHLKTGQRE
jgi:hypothetical protein